MRLPKLSRRKGAVQRADWVVVGLGNPGEEYAQTRHNVGFWAIGELARRHRAQFQRDSAAMRVANATIDGVRVAIVRPTTYVNASGKAVAAALKKAEAPPERAIIIYDDLDLELGAIRLRAGGSAGGNNGMKSIIGAVGGDVVRVRVGIGRPEHNGKPSWDPEVVADYVLSPPPRSEAEALRESASVAAEAAVAVIQEGVDAAGSRFNRRGPGRAQ